ncbi:MAG TPA: cytidylate kinase-like family protein [Ktedonobacteraceae bacterium]|nr:cytidylate kinase-like family protein [Ktedonobacteraceae bacterium]
MMSLFRGSVQPEQQAPKGSVEKETRVLPETAWQGEPMPTGVPPLETVVVTISRQFGSGGAAIARLVAQKSGLQYVDYEIINEVARRLGVDVEQAARQDEQTAGMVGHLLEAVRASNPFNVGYNTLLQPTPMLTQSREQAYLQLTQRVILEAASQGNAVIVGRGSQFLLHGVPRTLHISIFSPLPQRVENIMQRLRLDHAQAARLVEQRDYEHQSYLRRHYGSDGHQPDLYHLLINTGIFSFELAADFIGQALPVVKVFK